MQQKEVGNIAKRCVVTESLETFLRQAVDGMVASRMKNVGVCRFCQSTKINVLNVT